MEYPSISTSFGISFYRPCGFTKPLCFILIKKRSYRLSYLFVISIQLILFFFREHGWLDGIKVYRDKSNVFKAVIPAVLILYVLDAQKLIFYPYPVFSLKIESGFKGCAVKSGAFSIFHLIELGPS